MNTQYLIENMTLEQKIGQVISAGFHETYAAEGIKALIRDNHLGNVILFQRNFESPEKLYDTIKELQEIAMEANGVPLFIGIDQEGGNITRLWDGVTVFPGAMAISATKNTKGTKNAYIMGKYMGQELLSMGVNINYAPVLDINTNPDNPVINTRSFAEDRERAAEFAAAYCEGLQESVFASGKHFPGHGDTRQDSHLTLPVVDYDKERLTCKELYPFRKLVEKGIKTIMTTHIVFPAYDESGLPATLSEPILTGLLRDEMGFRGLILTDCMEMKAIADFYGTVKACVMALNAGADIMHVCHTRERQVDSMHEIKKAVLSDPSLMEKLDKAVGRILSAKAEMKETPSKDEMKRLLEDGSHRDEAARVCRESITLYKGTLVPYGKDEDFDVVFFNTNKGLTGAENRDPRGSGNLEKSFKEYFKNANILSFNANPETEDLEKLSSGLRKNVRTLVFTLNAISFPKQTQSVRRILAVNPDAFIMAMRSPYDIRKFSSVKNYAMAYDYTGLSIEAVLGAIRGDFVPTGDSPADLLKGI